MADAFLSAGILGQGDEAFLLEEEQCAGLVGVVSGDNDGSAFGSGLNAVYTVAVKAEGLVVDEGCGDQVSVVGGVVGIEEGGVLEVVCIQLAVVESLVGQDVVVIDDDLKGVAFLCKGFLYDFEDLCVGGGACADNDGVVICEGCGAEAGQSQNQSEDDRKGFLHFVILLVFNVFYFQ